MGLALSAPQARQMLCYLGLLQKWNRRFNLSALHTPAEMISGLLLDSLGLLPQMRPGTRRVLDVGSGGGAPGIPLAIRCPERSFCLLDRSANRCRFLARVRLELGLDNVQVVQAQVQEYHPAEPPQLLMARAVMPLSRLLKAVAHLCDAGTELLLPQGAVPAEELRVLPEGFELLETLPLQTPGQKSRRCLLRLRRHPAPA